jgi:cytochrome c oxidase subunit 2
MLAGAGVIAGIVFACLLVAFRRSRPGKPSIGFWLGGMGLVFPSVTLTALLVYALATGGRLLSHPGTADVLRVDGTARQWTWRFEFPSDGPPTIERGSLVIPVGRTVNFHVTSEDVIHSLCIARLGGRSTRRLAM